MRRLAAWTFVLYLFTSLAATFFARHADSMPLAIALSTFSTVAALVLAVALYAIVRDAEESLAVLALTCWTSLAAINTLQTLALRMLLSLTNSRLAAADTFVSIVLRARGWGQLASAILIVVGSAIFVQLLLRRSTASEVNA